MQCASMTYRGWTPLHANGTTSLLQDTERRFRRAKNLRYCKKVRRVQTGALHNWYNQIEAEVLDLMRWETGSQWSKSHACCVTWSNFFRLVGYEVLAMGKCENVFSKGHQQAQQPHKARAQAVQSVPRKEQHRWQCYEKGINQRKCGFVCK